MCLFSAFLTGLQRKVNIHLCCHSTCSWSQEGQIWRLFVCLSFFLDFFLSFSIFIHFHILFVRAALSSGGRPGVEPKLLGDRCPSAKCSLKATEREVSWENCRILPGYFPPGTAKENQSSEKNPNWHFGLVHTCAAIDWKRFFRGDLTSFFFFFPPPYHLFYLHLHMQVVWSCHANDKAGSSNVGFKNTMTCRKVRKSSGKATLEFSTANKCSGVSLIFWSWTQKSTKAASLCNVEEDGYLWKALQKRIKLALFWSGLPFVYCCI